MFVPSYNPSVFWVSECDAAPFKFGYSYQEAVNHYDNREHRYRKNQLFSELENEYQDQYYLNDQYNNNYNNHFNSRDTKYKCGV
jgi:hypothetical protein